VCFSSVAGDGGCHRRQGREEEKKLSQTHPFFGNSRGGGAWRRRATTVPIVPEASQNPSLQFLEF